MENNDLKETIEKLNKESKLYNDDYANEFKEKNNQLKKDCESLIK